MITCPYCSQSAEMVGGHVIYPNRPDLFAYNFWQCSPCGAYVGCHKTGDGRAPLGSLANAEVRDLRKMAHHLFDPLWKNEEGVYRARMTRGEAYRHLSKLMGIPYRKTHISWFQADECRLAIKVLREAGRKPP